MNLIDRLKELEANATPGPWKVDGCGDIYTPNPVKYPRLISISDEEDGSIGTTSYWSEGNPNAALIAEMRNVLPKLLAVVEAAEILKDLAAALLSELSWPAKFVNQNELDTAVLVVRDALAALEQE